MSPIRIDSSIDQLALTRIPLNFKMSFLLFRLVLSKFESIHRKEYPCDYYYPFKVRYKEATVSIEFRLKNTRHSSVGNGLLSSSNESFLFRFRSYKTFPFPRYLLDCLVPPPPLTYPHLTNTIYHREATVATVISLLLSNNTNA